MKDQCPFCLHVFKTTCSPNQHDGYFINDEQVEMVDAVGFVGVGNPSTLQWFREHCVDTVRCPLCKRIFTDGDRPDPLLNRQQPSFDESMWEQLEQLKEPVWVGNLISKEHTKALNAAGYTQSIDGFHWVTEKGVRALSQAGKLKA